MNEHVAPSALTAVRWLISTSDHPVITNPNPLVMNQAATNNQRKLFHRSRSGRARRAAPPHFCARPPTFLLLEGLDGARVVHHCDVQLSTGRSACLGEPSCGARGEKARCGGCVGVLSAPILPGALTADAQTRATPVSAPQAAPPPSTAVVMVTAKGGGPQKTDTPPSPLLRTRFTDSK